MQVSLTVCNVCQDPTRPTRHYEIRVDGKKGTPDLCDEHAAPLEALLPDAVLTTKRTAAATKKAAAPRARRAASVISLAEIEKGKQAGTL